MLCLAVGLCSSSTRSWPVAPPTHPFLVGYVMIKSEDECYPAAVGWFRTGKVILLQAGEESPWLSGDWVCRVETGWIFWTHSLGRNSGVGEILGTRRQGLCLGRGRLMPGGNPAVILPSRPQQPHPQDVACYRRTSMQGCEFVWQLLLSS